MMPLKSLTAVEFICEVIYIDVSKIYEQLEKIAELTAENSSLAMSLCSVAANKLLSMLKDKADGDDERVVLAAAYFANKLLLKSAFLSQSSVMSFKAGDISVSPAPEKAIAVADSMLCDALECISDLIFDNDFIFRRI